MTGSEDSGHEKAVKGEKLQVEEVVVEVLGDDRQERSSNISEEEERRLVRKLDRRIMPMLGLMYLFAGEYIVPLKPSSLMLHADILLQLSTGPT